MSVSCCFPTAAGHTLVTPSGLPAEQLCVDIAASRHRWIRARVCVHFGWIHLSSVDYVSHEHTVKTSCTRFGCTVLFFLSLFPKVFVSTHMEVCICLTIVHKCKRGALPPPFFWLPHRLDSATLRASTTHWTASCWGSPRTEKAATKTLSLTWASTSAS